MSAFNNAGFSIHADSLMGYAGDGLILTPVMAAIVIGGIGFPVLQDLRNRLRDPRHWSLHTKLTLSGTVLLLLGGFLVLNGRTRAPSAPCRWATSCCRLPSPRSRHAPPASIPSISAC